MLIKLLSREKSHAQLCECNGDTWETQTGLSEGVIWERNLKSTHDLLHCLLIIIRGTSLSWSRKWVPNWNVLSFFWLRHVSEKHAVTISCLNIVTHKGWNERHRTASWQLFNVFIVTLQSFTTYSTYAGAEGHYGTCVSGFWLLKKKGQIFFLGICVSSSGQSALVDCKHNAHLWHFVNTSSLWSSENAKKTR